jgi:hypothetical protein
MARNGPGRPLRDPTQPSKSRHETIAPARMWISLPSERLLDPPAARPRALHGSLDLARALPGLQRLMLHPRSLTTRYALAVCIANSRY